MMNETSSGGTASTYRIIGLGVLAAIVVAAAAVWLFASGGDDGEQQVLGVLDDNRPVVGEPAPDFALISVHDGESVVRLSDFRGKVVVLNWYATWCGPCRSEIPDFQEAYTHLSDDIVIFGVNLQEERAQAAGLLEELGATYPAVLDDEGLVAEHYRVVGLPVTLIIDRDGIVTAEGRGIMTEEALRGQLAQFGLKYPES